MLGSQQPSGFCGAQRAAGPHYSVNRYRDVRSRSVPARLGSKCGVPVDDRRRRLRQDRRPKELRCVYNAIHISFVDAQTGQTSRVAETDEESEERIAPRPKFVNTPRQLSRRGNENETIELLLRENSDGLEMELELINLERDE